VRLGELNLAKKDPTEVDYDVEQFISHEKYNTKTSHNDIAVIKLAKVVTFTKFIRPACLAQLSTTVKEKAVASGWGFTEVGGNTADILQKVELSIIDNKRCNELYNDPENYDIDGTQICAGELAGGKDTCGGDSGGQFNFIKY
jgi:prostasin